MGPWLCPPVFLLSCLAKNWSSLKAELVAQGKAPGSVRRNRLGTDRGVTGAGPRCGRGSAGSEGAVSVCYLCHNKGHGLGGLNNRNRISPSCGGCKSTVKVSAGLVPPGGRGCPTAFSLACRRPPAPEPSHGPLYLLMSTCPLLVRHQSYWTRAHPDNLTSTYFFKVTLSPQKGTSETLGIRTSTCDILGVQFSPE